MQTAVSASLISIHRVYQPIQRAVVSVAQTYINSPVALSEKERLLLTAGSTDRCNTFCELLSRRLIEQGLSRPFIELPCDGAELGLAVQGQIGATRKILAQQSVGVFV